MKPTLGCGHTEYDRGHCGMPGCPNDYFTCPHCCPPQQRRGDQRGFPRRRETADDLRPFFPGAGPVRP